MKCLQMQLEQVATKVFSSDFSELTQKEKYNCVALLVCEKANEKMKITKKNIKNQQLKEVYYFSMEFLLGRMLLNNIENMGIYSELNEVLKKYNLTIKDLENEEIDVGLGNGGLGRLAACFLDSIASLDYPGHGVTLRYRNGFFNQAFVDGNQTELADYWLRYEQPWEQQKSSESCIISFYGEVVNENKDGQNKRKLVNTTDFLAMPYDMPIVGVSNTVNTLRMYDVCPPETLNTNNSYEQAALEITKNLYPNDETYEGKELRLKQQYVFVSAGLQNIINKHLKNKRSLDEITNYVVIQINDTHPVLLIPELMRILIDDYDYTYECAWTISQKMFAYTNHTVLKEALEEWDIVLFKKLLPRIYEIIKLINCEFIKELEKKGYEEEQILKMTVIDDTKVKMANLAMIASFCVNGVAALHTKIIKEGFLKNWHSLYPQKIVNKTNGITQRRWLMYSNPKLWQHLLNYEINTDRHNPVTWFEQFLTFCENKEFLQKLMNIKEANKKSLAKHIFSTEGWKINSDSIFDIQIKRFHAYKRQLLNVLHVIYLYQKLKTDKIFYEQFNAQTFIFGGKAAPSYVFAKSVISLIKLLEQKINNDAYVSKKLMVVMATNYNVSYAEKLIRGADISEQISTAGFEASGTGNMKFMMNGALTLGTLDGANVEIHELVGSDNIQIFGLLADEVKAIHKKKYDAKSLITVDKDLENIIHWIKENNMNKKYDPILKNLFDENDYYLVLKDFSSYKEAQQKLNKMYRNKEKWYQKTAINIAKSGFFSSDRTIGEYVFEIWNLEKIKF